MSKGQIVISYIKHSLRLWISHLQEWLINDSHLQKPQGGPFAGVDQGDMHAVNF